eukprot:scaffold7834_cov672-Prasinococcus_capsulatus_cf.AAC.1
MSTSAPWGRPVPLVRSALHLSTPPGVTRSRQLSGATPNLHTSCMPQTQDNKVQRVLRRGPSEGLAPLHPAEGLIGRLTAKDRDKSASGDCAVPSEAFTYGSKETQA